MIKLYPYVQGDEIRVFELTKAHIAQFELRTYLGLDNIYRQVEKRIMDHVNDIFRIYHDDEHIGYITLVKIDDGIIQIDDFYIFDDYQRNGYGSQTIEKLTKENNHLQLYVFRNNPVAIKLYKKFNFKVIENDAMMYKMEFINTTSN